TPPDYASYSARRKQEWQAEFRASAEGNTLERQTKRFSLVLAPDWTFRADDVPSGRYQFIVNSRERLDEGRSVTFKTSLVFQRSLSVPEAEPGRADEPFDVGDVVLAPRGRRGPEVGQEVPPFAARMLDGAPLNLADYRGKYVLLAFWATWCAPCRAEMPHVKAAFEAFGKDERFAMVGLSLDDSIDAPRRYAAENGLGWTQGFLGREPSE